MKFKLFFLVVNIFLCSFFIDARLGANALSRILPIVSYLKDKTVYFDYYEKYSIDKAYINGHFYSDKPPLSTIVSIPGIYLLNKLKPLNFEVNSDDDMINLGKKVIAISSISVGSLAFLLILLAFYLSQSKSFTLEKQAYSLILLLYSSNLYIYSAAVWGGLLASALLLLSTYQYDIKKNYYLSGIFMSLAICSLYQVAIFFAIYVLFLVPKKTKNAVEFVIGSLPFIFLLMYYHYYFTGNPFIPLYKFVYSNAFSEMKSNMGFTLPKIDVLWELVFGQRRGLFFYTPALFYIMFLFCKNNIPLSLLKNSKTFWTCLCYTLLISSFFLWTGGCAHGSRYMLPVLAILLYKSYPMILQDHKYKIFFLISSGVGVVLNIIAKSVYPIYDDKLIFPITEHVFPAFVRGDLWSSDLFNLLTDINKQVSALLFFIVFCVLCYVFKKQDKTQN